MVFYKLFRYKLKLSAGSFNFFGWLGILITENKSLPSTGGSLYLFAILFSLLEFILDELLAILDLSFLLLYDESLFSNRANEFVCGFLTGC